MRSVTRPGRKTTRPSVRHCGPPLLEDPGRRYAACPYTFKIGLVHRAVQRALPNGPLWRIKVIPFDRKPL